MKTSAVSGGLADPMLAGGNGVLWLMSTPLGKPGFFWETWDRGKDPRTTSANSPTPKTSSSRTNSSKKP